MANFAKPGGYRVGQRGPLPRSAAKAARLGRPSHGARKGDLVVRPASPPPAAPTRLGAGGLAAWEQAFRSASWLNAGHLAMVEDLARLRDDVELYRKAMTDHGALLGEPIVSPKGDVVGTRFVANPAEAMLRRALKAILELQTALGLTPMAKARLGLNLVETEQKISTLDRLRKEAGGRQEDALVRPALAVAGRVKSKARRRASS